MEVYACKRTCEKCFYCNEVGGGFIDCYYGIFIDPTTTWGMPVQTNLDKFHKCDNFAPLE